MTNRHASGVLDTCTYLDLDALDPDALPKIPEITAITLAELNQGDSVGPRAAALYAQRQRFP